jgi:hypothetical protein
MRLSAPPVCTPIVLVCLLGACGQFAETPAPFPLEWRGIEANPRPSSPVAEALRKPTFQVDPCVDSRKEPTTIGVVQKDNSAVRTSSSVAEFCTQHVRDIFERAGAKVVPSGGSVILKPELLVFEVIEGGMFNGEAVLRVTAAKDGKTVYAGTHNGKSKRWGRSRNPINYNEALSNALFEATKKLLNDDLFAKGLEGSSEKLEANAH